jgi:predicted PurR-regulated permease PerM
MKIEIDTKTFIRFLVVVSAFVATIFLLWKLIPVLLIIGISFFLALALNKPVSYLARRLPGHSRVLATALSYIMLISFLGLFASLVVPPLVRQTGVFIDSLPSYIEDLSKQRGVVAELISRYHLQEEVGAFVSGAQNQAGSFAQGIGSNVVAGVSTLLSGFITMLTVLVLTFLMLIEGPRWKEKLWQSYSNQRLLKRHQDLVGKMYRVITSYINGQVLVACIAGSLASLTLFILSTIFSVPTSAVLPLGVIILLTSLVPMIGATIGACIVFIALLFSDPGAALVFLIYFFIYQQIENNIIQPAVQSRTVEMSALTVFVAAIIGVMLLGLLGGILAIPFAGCLRVIILDYIDHQQKIKQREQKLAKARTT